MIKHDPISFLFRILWKYSIGTRSRIVLYVTLSSISMLFWTLQPAVIGELLNSIQTVGGVTEANMRWVMLLVIGLFAVDVGAWFFHGPARIIEQKNAHHALQQYRKHLIHGVLQLPIQWHGERDSGHTLDKINKACDGLISFGKNSFQVVHFVVRMFVTFIVLWYYSALIALVTLALIFFSFYVTFQFDKKIVTLLTHLHSFENSITAKITDALTNIFSVKILHIEKPILTGIMNASYADKSTYLQHTKVQELKWFTGAVIFSFIGLVPMFVYIYFQHASGEAFEVGTFMALYLYSSNLIYVYFTFNGNFEEMMRWKSRILNVADIEEAITQNEKHPRKKVGGEWNALTVRSVFFTYDSLADKQLADQTFSPGLSNVGLTIRKGQRIALIGTSGSGKTTFLKVLHGMYKEAEGEYSVDGSRFEKTTFSDIDLESTLVPQEPEIFSSTIRENITLAQDYTDAEIDQALAMARFTDVLPLLPQGLDSVVNEKGVNLSGGQKQRLALARALLFSSRKSLLLLDESTSSVDPENEARIYENIFEWWSGYTVIATIHKLHLLKYFDRIIIFDKGTIVDDGTLQELITRNAQFRIQWAEYAESHASDH